MIESKVFEKFESYLNDRIQAGLHLTEDSVRYSFFAALTNTCPIKQHEIVLELPHPIIPKAQIDTYIKSSQVEAYIEFKFHRTSNSSSPKPQKAGSLFKDFNRLSILNGKSKKYVVYFTDEEMAKYFQKHEKQYSGFWSLNNGNFEFNQAFIDKTTATFSKECGGNASSKIEVIFSSKLDSGHEIRAFGVEEI